MKIYRNIPQGTQPWFGLRLGIPTASCFDEVMTPATHKLSASWKMYACRLVAERLINVATDSLDGQRWMENGKDQEPKAVQRFEAVNDVETTPITFIKTDDGSMGCSPDRVILSSSGLRLLTMPGGEQGIDASASDFVRLVEIKSPSLPVWLNYRFFGRGTKYECQLQGQMLVTETDENVFYCYTEHAPQQLTIVTHRDDAFIKDLSATLREFNDKLHEFHEIAKKLGEWQAFKEVVTPLEKERGEAVDPRYGAAPPTMGDAELDQFLSGDDIGTGRFAG
jgi:hypothetical protein